jgi:hypothetical protein
MEEIDLQAYTTGAVFIQVLDFFVRRWEYLIAIIAIKGVPKFVFIKYADALY